MSESIIRDQNSLGLDGRTSIFSPLQSCQESNSLNVLELPAYLSSTSPFCSRWRASVMTECRIWWPIESSAWNRWSHRRKQDYVRMHGVFFSLFVNVALLVWYLVCTKLLPEAKVRARNIHSEVVLHPLQEQHPALTLLLKCLLLQNLSLQLTAPKKKKAKWKMES